jgi:hypothetical protein
MGKANSAADSSGEAVGFPAGSRFRGGEAFHPSQGGMVTTPDGSLYSVSHPNRVPNGGYDGPTREGDTFFIAKNRIGEVALGSSDGKGVPNGFEDEFTALDADDGRLARVAYVNKDGSHYFSGKLGEVGRLTQELYNFSVEWNSPKTYSAAETRETIVQGLAEVVDAGAADGKLIAPIEVIGQQALGKEHSNPDKYVQFTSDYMPTQSGFPLEETFAVNAAQALRGTKEKLAVVTKAAYYMQFVNPLLTAKTLAGPFYAGSRETTKLSEFSDHQQRHMQEVGVTPNDLLGKFMSRRYVLRRVGSPSAGTWLAPPPETEEEYLDQAHTDLQSQRISSVDRLMGEHTDRARLVLGAFENCSLGNVGDLDKMTCDAIVANAIYSSVEQMIARGQKPEALFPDIFGYTHLGKKRALQKAHESNLNIHRFGMDAFYNGKPAHAYGERLLELARFGEKRRVPNWAIGDFLSSYVSNQKTRDTLYNWCRQTGQAPSMEAFHQTGIGIPAVYLHEIFNYNHQKYPNLPEADIIRLCDLDLARSFVRDVDRHVTQTTRSLGTRALAPKR